MSEEDLSQCQKDDVMCKFYSDYVGIHDAHKLVAHCETIRARLSEDGQPYKCINRYKFLASRLSTRFYYPRIIGLAKHPEAVPLFIDVGCCTGTDLRWLMWEGYPASKLLGTDKSLLYIDCGYDLFNDRGKCPIQFKVGDMLDPDFVATLADQAGIVHAGSVIHLFQSVDTMRAFVRSVATLLKPNGWFAGTHVASNKTAPVYMPKRQQTKYFISTDDFCSALEDEGFGNIEFQFEPRTAEPEEDAVVGFQRYWLSFTAVYQPSSSS